MNLRTKTTGLVIALNTALVAVASAHPGPPGHTHGDDWPFGMVALVVVAASTGIYGALLKIRDSRKTAPIPVKVRKER